MDAESLDDIDDEIHSRYHILSLLGRGAYGIVWRARDKLRPNRVVAVKKICEAFRNEEDALRTFREVEILLRLNEFPHPNIVRLINVVPARNDTDVYLIFDYLEHSLMKVIQSSDLQNIHRKYIGYQIVRAMHFLHSADVLHRDLKPSNVLIDKDCNVKLCDFGLARVQPIDFYGYDNNDDLCMTDYIATRWYRAPELLLGTRRYNKAIDVWALGCILLELETKIPAFPGKNNEDQLLLTIQTAGIESNNVLFAMSEQYEKIYKYKMSCKQKSNDVRDDVGDDVSKQQRQKERQNHQNYQNHTQIMTKDKRDMKDKQDYTENMNNNNDDNDNNDDNTNHDHNHTSENNIDHNSQSTTNQDDDNEMHYAKSGLSKHQYHSAAESLRLIMHMRYITYESKSLATRLKIPKKYHDNPIKTLLSQLNTASTTTASTPTTTTTTTTNAISDHVSYGTLGSDFQNVILLYDLLRKMLVFDPKKRISVQEVLLHPYFATFVIPNSEPTCTKPLQLRLPSMLQYPAHSHDITNTQYSKSTPKSTSKSNTIKLFSTQYQLGETFYRNHLYHLISELKLRQLPSASKIQSSYFTIMTRTYGRLCDSILNIMQLFQITQQDIQQWDVLSTPFEIEELESDIDEMILHQSGINMENIKQYYDMIPLQTASKAVLIEVDSRDVTTAISTATSTTTTAMSPYESIKLYYSYWDKISFFPYTSQMSDLEKDKYDLLRYIEYYAHQNQSMFYSEFVDTLIMLYIESLSIPFLTCYDNLLLKTSTLMTRNLLTEE